jgi:hypothetical protein
LIGAAAIFSRPSGSLAGAPTPSAIRASPGGALDLGPQLAELERRARAAEERAREAEDRARDAEDRVRELEARLAPPRRPTAPPAPSDAPELHAQPYDGPAKQVAFLTLVCNPSCDEVTDNGVSLGTSPIVHREVAPGLHRIVLRKDTQTKTLSLELHSGDTIVQRINVK